MKSLQKVFTILSLCSFGCTSPIISKFFNTDIIKKGIWIKNYRNTLRTHSTKTYQKRFTVGPCATPINNMPVLTYSPECTDRYTQTEKIKTWIKNPFFKPKTESLHDACGKPNFIDVVYYVATGSDVNEQSSHGFTPLHFACFTGNQAIVKFLLDNNADPSITDCWGKTALFYCNTSEIIKLLLTAKNINVDHQDENGETALHGACLNNDHDRIQALLEAKARMLKDNSGKYPYFYADKETQTFLKKYIRAKNDADLIKIEIEELYTKIKNYQKEVEAIIKIKKMTAPTTPATQQQKHSALYTTYTAVIGWFKKLWK